MSVLISETESERRVISAVQEELQDQVNATSLAEVAGLLDLHPDGVRSLLLKEWPLQKAFRVAEALKFDLSQAL